LGLLERGALVRLVSSEPGKITVAHLRPGRGERKELALVQPLRTRDFASRQIEQANAVRMERRAAAAKRLMKSPQHPMQPVAEVALVDLGVDFIVFLQTELPQRKEPIRTATQVFVGGGGKLL